MIGRSQSPDPFAPGLLRRLPESPRKVALVRASRIGDFVCATPSFRALRAALPDAEVTLIGLPFVRDLVMRSPYLDRFVEFPGYPGIAEQFFHPARALEFFEAMQGEEFDLAIQMNGSGVHANPFTLMLGARVTAGTTADAHWPSILAAAYALPEERHEIDRWLAFFDFLGAPALGRDTDFPLWRADAVLAAELLNGADRPLIGVHAGTRDDAKRWPAARFAEAARHVRAQFGGTVVLIGGDEERSAGDRVLGSLGEGLLDLIARTTVPQAGAVIGQMAILLTNDSAPAHIAYALGTPTVTVFGASDPARWGPPPLARHQVVAPGISGQVDKVRVEAVVDAALLALAGAPSGETSH